MMSLVQASPRWRMQARGDPRLPSYKQTPKGMLLPVWPQRPQPHKYIYTEPNSGSCDFVMARQSAYFLFLLLKTGGEAGEALLLPGSSFLAGTLLRFDLFPSFYRVDGV